MPVRNLIMLTDPEDPESREIVPPDQAIERFEEAGAIPYEIISMILDDLREGTVVGRQFLSPSMCCPDTTCRKQVMIERFMDYDLEATQVWAKLEARVWHDAFCKQGRREGGAWQHEVWVPRGLALDPARRAECVVMTEDDKERIEIWPGFPMQGVVDRARPDWSEIIDHKTSVWPRTFARNGDVPSDKYRAKQAQEWSLQINLYRYMIEDLTGMKVNDMWAWRTYRGSRNYKYTFSKLAIPRVSREAMWNNIGQWLTEFRDWLKEGVSILENSKDEEHLVGEKMEALIKRVPQDGHLRQMFAGTRCTKYCAVRDICFRSEGVLQW